MLKRPISTVLAVLLAVIFVGEASLEAQQEVGFIERFALAKDRRDALKELIPGTADYYYYHCLHFQNEGQLNEAQAMIDQWRSKLGDTQQVQNMVSRQMLLAYDSSPQQTLDYLKRTLGLNFNHPRPRKDRAASLPTQLDNARFDTEKLLKQAIAQDNSLNQIETEGLALVLGRNLSVNQMRAVLNRLRRADLEGVVPLIAKELQLRDSRGFGWAQVHSLLTLEQLEELRREVPSLYENDRYVRAYAARLAPPEGTSLTNKVELRNYLNRLHAWTKQLPASQNSLKALVLGNLLRLDLSEEVFNRARFLEYLRLPRKASYYDLRRFRNQRVSMAVLNYAMQPEIPLPPMRDDDELVRKFLEHYLVEDETPDQFAQFLTREYVEKVLAETKILNGIGDPATWYAKLSPNEQRSLRDRVELQFAPHNESHYRADDKVRLDVEVKNVEELVVKIFEINTSAYLRNNDKRLDTSIDLDGLVANAQKTIKYSQAADRRHVESIDLPELDGRGVWVVDLLGGGRRSRALIKKGDLVAIERLGDAGHVFKIYDENGQAVDSAHIELGGRIFANVDGKIILPYGEQNVTRKILLVDSDFAVGETIQHRSENYKLQSAFLLSRQSLVAGTQAAVTINSRLACNGFPISIRLLESPSLTITATDAEGVSSSQTISDLDLDDSVDFVHSFLVPQRLRSLTFELSGKILNSHRQTLETVTASRSIACNGIAASNQIGDFFFQRKSNPGGADSIQLAVLGRNGEALGKLPVTLTVKHELFKAQYSVTVATNEDGLVDLGTLEGIEEVRARVAGMRDSSFQPHRFHRDWPGKLHLAEQESVTLPLGKSSSSDQHFSLYEIRRGQQYLDHGDQLNLSAGVLAIKGLDPGDYVLTDHEYSQVVRLYVSEGTKDSNYLIGPSRILQTKPFDSLLITDIKLTDKSLTATIQGADDAARVHLIANVFDAAPTGRGIQLPEVPLLSKGRRIVESSFVNSLRLDEEYTYILNRQGADKFPGNLLPQPTLLIHPWEVSITENNRQEAAAGDDFSSMAPQAMAMDSMAEEAQARRQQNQVDWQGYDFLAGGAAVIANIEIKDGKIEIPVEELDGYSEINIVAVHPTSVDSRAVTIGRGEIPTRDRRLNAAFEPGESLAQKQSVQFLAAGEKKTLGDPTTRRFKTFTQLSDVFQLYSTLLSNGEWEKFRFLTQWPDLSAEQKLARYNELACHEVNFFLYHKDRQFFDSVVKPLLQQKTQKQLLDHWLLGESIERYAEIWQTQRLNTLERLLLAQSATDTSEGTARWLRDYLEANPIAPELRQQRFEFALRGDALQTTNGAVLGLEMLGEAEADGLMELSRGGAMAGGGFGGGGGGLGGRARGRGNAPGAPSERFKSLGLKQRRAKSESAIAENMFGVERSLDAGVSQLGFFQSLDQTKEWAETQFYKVKLADQSTTLIQPNAFWQQFLDAGCEPFLPQDLDLPVSTLNEAICALAVIDLPFKADQPEMKIEEGKLVMSGKQQAVVFLESIEASEASDKPQKILVGQDIYLLSPGIDSRMNRPLGGEELLQGVAYKAKVVVTNPSNERQQVKVLTQLPAGSMPLSGNKTTRSTALELQPYSTSQLEYVFYFPESGEFSHYGAQVSSESQTIAGMEAVDVEVIPEPKNVDETSWSYVADWGTNAQVLEFLKTANLQQLDLGRIAFRMADQEFYQECVAVLGAAARYDAVLWAYAVRHNDAEGIADLLHQRGDFTDRLGPSIDSTLLTLDPVEEFDYEHLDYKPLVVARAHQLGQTRKVLNPSLYSQYIRLQNVLAHQAEISDAQKLELCYYLLLQNRLQETLAWFEQVDPDQVSGRMQYDYFDAYLDFYRGEFDRAASIARTYADYPIPRWQELFGRISEQVAERKALMSGQTTSFVSRDERDNSQRILADERNRRNEMLAKQSPSLSLEIQGKQLAVDAKNIEDVTINYYLMDLELLFSRNPFVSREDDSPVIQPNLTQKVDFSIGAGERLLDVPEPLKNRNLLVEVSGGGLSRSQVLTANALNVTLMESFGQLSVLSEEGRGPVEGAYVKVYARHNDGSVKFFKDGYTDLRGRFDYATLSTSDLNTTKRFAILVLDPQLGAVVQEAAPPTR